MNDRHSYSAENAVDILINEGNKYLFNSIVAKLS